MSQCFHSCNHPNTLLCFREMSKLAETYLIKSWKLSVGQCYFTTPSHHKSPLGTGISTNRAIFLEGHIIDPCPLVCHWQAVSSRTVIIYKILLNEGVLVGSCATVYIKNMFFISNLSTLFSPTSIGLALNDEVNGFELRNLFFRRKGGNELSVLFFLNLITKLGHLKIKFNLILGICLCKSLMFRMCLMLSM